MKDKILAVKEFHKAFKLDYLEEPKADLFIGGLVIIIGVIMILYKSKAEVKK